MNNEGENMIAELREMLGLNDLRLDYMVTIEEFDGECFTFSVRATNDNVKDLYEKIHEKMTEYQKGVADAYAGYIDVNEEQDKVSVYYDTGNVEDGLAAMHGLLYALNEIPEVQSVVINEI